MNENEAIIELADHLGGAIDEVGGDVALVELHTVDETHGRFGRLPFLNSDHAILAHLLQGLSEQIADRAVVVGTDSPNLRHFFGTLHLLCHLREAADGSRHGLLNSPAHSHWIAASSHHAGALAENRPGEHGRGGGAVAGEIGGLGGNFVHELRAHVFEGILQINLLAHSHAVFRDGGTTKRLVDDDVAPGGAHRHRYGAGQFFHALEQLGTCVVVEQKLFGHGTFSSGWTQKRGMKNLACTAVPNGL